MNNATMVWNHKVFCKFANMLEFCYTDLIKNWFWGLNWATNTSNYLHNFFLDWCSGDYPGHSRTQYRTLHSWFSVAFFVSFSYRKMQHVSSWTLSLIGRAVCPKYPQPHHLLLIAISHPVLRLSTPKVLNTEHLLVQFSVRLEEEG